MFFLTMSTVEYLLIRIEPNCLEHRSDHSFPLIYIGSLICHIIIFSKPIFSTFTAIHHLSKKSQHLELILKSLKRYEIDSSYALHKEQVESMLSLCILLKRKCLVGNILLQIFHMNDLNFWGTLSIQIKFNLKLFILVREFLK